MSHPSQYVEKMKEQLYLKVSSEINMNTFNDVVEDLNFHLNNPSPRDFHKYYFNTIANTNYFLTNQFFSQFNRMYSLRADKGVINRLELRKREIMNHAKDGLIVELYFEVFNRVEAKHGNTTIKKTLSSFFTKLLHTLHPSEYCALDNPVKNYLGLQHEGFFVSFIAINDTYKKFAVENKELIKRLREEFRNLDQKQKFVHDKVSDLKLLDLIFWRKADVIEQRRKAERQRKKGSS